MSDDDGGASPHQRLHCGLHMTLRLRVERRGRFVEDQYRCVLQYRSGNCQALSLPAGETDAVLTNDRVKSLGECANEVECVRGGGRLLDGVAANLRHRSVGDVGRHGVIEQDDLLTDQRDVTAQVGER